MATVKCAATACLLSNMAASISRARNGVTEKTLYIFAPFSASEKNVKIKKRKKATKRKHMDSLIIPSSAESTVRHRSLHTFVGHLAVITTDNSKLSHGGILLPWDPPALRQCTRLCQGDISLSWTVTM